MFLQFYNLREQPFGMTPDPRLLWSSTSHREAFASLVYGIETGRGFVALIAKPGMGKTTLLFRLLERLQSSARTAFLFQSQGNAREFFSNLAADLGLDPPEQDLGKMQRQLNEVLVRESQAGRRFVLIIDEAQNLEDSVLESVRMLSNFETEREKLIQIVLSGQPQLADKLMRPELSQLRQRVSVIAHLDALDGEEVAYYIHHRLAAAGYPGGELFTPEAMAMVADHSEGIPRNINNICFHALSVGFAAGKRKIDGLVMQEVLSDLNLGKLRSRRASGVRRSTAAGANRPEPRQTRQPRRNAFATGVSYPLQNARPLSPHVPSPPREDVGGRLFWAAAVITLAIWAAVFWDSASAVSLRNTAGQMISAAAPQVTATVKNVRAALRISPTEGGTSKSNRDQSDEADTTSAAHPPSGQAASLQAPPVESGLDTPDAMNSENAADTPASSDATVPPERVSDQPHDAERKVSHTRRHHELETRWAPVAPTGDVVVESDVPGGRITVNGRNESNWVTPHILKLSPGTYRISVSKGGYSRWSQVVRVREGAKRWVMANLGEPSGLLVLKTDPPGLGVYIDGRYYGTGNVQATLAAGEHTYKLVPPSGHTPFEGKFNLQAGRVLMKQIHWQDSSSRLEGNISAGGDDKLSSAARRSDS